ncbi:MAG: hypothetical protein IPH88_11370 [Bacteroidales bacterium]|nr:hypothetical protein [Bacteroidales bacterium]
MSIFKITFKRKLEESKKDKILEILIINLSGTLFRNIERINDKKIIIDGEFYSFNPIKNVPWNIWTGFSKRAEVSITDNNEIHYSLDYTYAVINGVLGGVFLSIFFVFIPLFLQEDITWVYLLYFLIIYLPVSVFSLGIGILYHRSLFLYTLKFGSRFKGKYDWEKILKAKSVNELQDIANGRTLLTLEVQNLAQEELLRRKELK